MAVRVAVIGVGDFGVKHVKVLKERADVRVVAVCRRNERKVRAVAREFGVPGWSTDAASIIDDPDIDAVVIATAEDTHYPLTRAAVLQGKHVLLEKPICLDPEQGRRLVDMVESSDSIVLPGHLLRYDAAYCEAQRRIASGVLGEIVSIKAKRNVPRKRFKLHSRTHPVFMALAHDIDIVLWLTGRLPRKVYALERRSDPSYDTPDVFFGLMELEDGVLCQVETQWTYPDRYGRYLDVELEIMTTKGHLKLRYPGGNLEVADASGLSSADLTLWPEIHGATGGALAHQAAAFIGSIRGTVAKPAVTVREAMRAIEVGHLLIQSAARQREIRPDWT